MARANPGDVICLEAGTYHTKSNVEIDRSGSRSAPITVTGYQGTATVQYTGRAMDGGVFQTSFCRPWCATHDLVIENLTLDGGGRMDAGVFVREGVHDVTVRDCVIRNTGAAGVAVNAADYVTLEHNLVYRAGYEQGWSSGISLWYGGPNAVYGGATAGYDSAGGFHNFIVDNIISGVYDGSAHHSDGNGIIVDGSGMTPAALIANNLVYENGGAGIEVYANLGDIWVVNNTAYANGLDPQLTLPAADYFVNRASHVHLANDLAYGVTGRRGDRSSYLYSSLTHSSIDWATSIGYSGTNVNVAPVVTNDPREYRYMDPRLESPPAVPRRPRPWAVAVPPWRIAENFELRSDSLALGAGSDPTAGMTASEASSAATYLKRRTSDQAGSAPDVGASVQW